MRADAGVSEREDSCDSVSYAAAALGVIAERSHCRGPFQVVAKRFTLSRLEGDRGP
jgi:hypothetical protein